MSILSALQAHIYLAWDSVGQCWKVYALQIYLKVFKCNHFGKGIDVFLGCKKSYICPVAAVLS